MPADREDPELERLLEYLKSQRGFDFTGYKRSSLARRIAKRLEAVECSGYDDYVDYLEVHPEEFAFLFNTILINVTAFYRDLDAWEYLAGEVLPQLLSDKPAGEPIRVWSAGCASGEETYTAAFVVCEALGEREYLDRVKIYATDVDEEALDEARSATYTHKQVEAIPPAQLERYLERTDTRYSVRKDLRRTVIFGRNDLVQDAPISRIDLLICRNTLMYFNAETQARILSRFHFALQPHGVLFMGKSEMLVTHADQFTPVNLKRRVFRKTGSRGQTGPLTSTEWLGGDGDNPHLEAGYGFSLRDLVIEGAPIAQIVVDRAGVLQLANQQARTLMSITTGDVGRPFRDLEISYRPVEIRSHLERVFDSHTAIALDATEVNDADGGRRMVEVLLSPLVDGDDVLGASISFTDATRRLELRDGLERSRRELEISYEELQSTVEELETTNEELQSTNEELETTNEELQSTNEELETMNEELQSTNEELETINDELRLRTLELNQVNSFMQTILTSLGLSVIVLDQSLRVQVWNRQSFELWGLREDEVRDEHLLGLDFGLPVEELKRSLRAALDGGADRTELTVVATNRRGKAITCDVAVVGLRIGDDITGVILLIQPGAPAT